MTQLLLLVLLAVLLLAWLGRMGTPRSQRLPWRQWTPVHVMDLTGRGFRVLVDAGQERQRRAEAARESVEGRDPPPGDEDGSPPRGPTP
jgi:hypothetical protein